MIICYNRIRFNVRGISYDANGNILSMNQKGFKINGSALIDRLTYACQTNSNFKTYHKAVTDKWNGRFINNFI